MLKVVPPMKSARWIYVSLLAGLTLVAALAGLRTINSRSVSSNTIRAARLAEFPKVILWAWERPEELEFIDPRRVGVAFLARTLYLRDESLIVRPRLQPLKVPNGTSLVAVVRIETDRHEPPQLSTAQREQAVAAISELTEKPDIRAIQIDFDATLSERAFYRALIFDLRGRMPEAMPLSITALASWCTRDDWLSKLPVDEAVPMLFRMGADERQIRLHLSNGGGFTPAACRTSVGVSTDEPFPTKEPRPSVRTYIFNPQTWTPASVRDTLENKYKHEHTDS